MSVATQRCPRCGNENRADSFSCTFCGKRLRIEAIERIPLFRRYEAEEWVKPDPWYRKIINLFIKPNYAFWDINHKRSKSPGFLILWFNALLYGLMGLAFFSHFRIVSINGTPISPFSLYLFAYNMSVFIAFFLFGLVYQFLFFSVMIWLFSRGANYAVNYSERLEARFESDSDTEKYREEDMSPFSIYKGGVLLQKQQSHKYKMMMSAFAPFLLINAIKALIILVAFPTVQIEVSSTQFSLDIYNSMFQANVVWTILDVIDALTLAIWVPILAAISIRELSNSSTYRVLISSIIVGVLGAIFLFFLRPTLFG